MYHIGPACKHSSMSADLACGMPADTSSPSRNGSRLAYETEAQTAVMTGDTALRQLHVLVGLHTSVELADASDRSAGSAAWDVPAAACTCCPDLRMMSCHSTRTDSPRDSSRVGDLY